MRNCYSFKTFLVTLFLLIVVAPLEMWAAGDYFTITNLNTNARKFKFTKSGSPAFVLSMEYSTDGGTSWTTWTDPTAWLTIPANGSYCFRGVNPNGLSNSNGVGYYYWDAYTSSAFKVSGDVMSLVCGDNDRSTIPSDYCFYRTFAQSANWKANMQNDGLVLSASTLKKGCYSYMFAGCTSASFVTAPDFTAATNIPDYAMAGMFQGCTKLTTVAPLTTITQIGVAGCDSMFLGCSVLPQIMEMPNLKTIGAHGCAYMYSLCAALKRLPDFTMDVIGDKGCYRTFFDCAKIDTIGNLTAQNVGVDGCNEMFNRTPKLSLVGDIKVGTLDKRACYRMFSNYYATTRSHCMVQSLTVDVAADSACYEMFAVKTTGYSKLDSIRSIHIRQAGKYALANMFAFQGWLQKVDTIDIGEIGEYACYQMFNTSSVKTINLLRSSRVKPYGCANMFTAASALNTIDSIKVPVVEHHGFYQMCNGRTTLTTVNGIEVDRLEDYAAYQMFMGCSALATIPQQTPVKYIGANACQQMFQSDVKITRPMAMNPKYIGTYGCDQMYNSCSLLASVPAMRVGYIDRAGCRRMFYYCPKVATIGSLRADTVAAIGCQEMFYTKASGNVACTIDTLEAKVLGDSACWYMFGGGTSYTKISSVKLLKADKVGDYACQRMFDQCSKLTAVNEIRVKEVGKYGNWCMFTTCSVLATLPDTLSAHLVKDAGCYQMFNACPKIAKLPVMLADTVQRLGCYKMYTSCNNSTLVKVPDMKVDYAGDSAFFQMFISYTYLKTVDTLRANTLGIAACQEMFNGCTGINQVEKIALKNVGERGCYRQFYACTGLNIVKDWTVDSIGKDGMKEKFSTCYYLASVPSVLPAVYIGNGGCESMFAEDKKSLVNAPKIAANYVGERGCYQMFYNCSALVTPPEKLQATKICKEGYMRMFMGCAQLTSAPTIMADSVGVSGSQEMFSGCIALVTAPTIQYQYVNDYGCYLMFNGCIKLTSVQTTLPATHVGEYGYAKMFNGCKVLTKGSDISCTEVGRSGCEQMYENCVALQTGPTNLYPTKASPRCYYQMFNGCTVLQNVPYIHATTIADSACYNMCLNCSTAVTTQTQLHATTIGDRGCFQMFYRCVKLNNVFQMNLKSIGAYGCYYMYRQCLALPSVPDMHCDKVGTNGCNLMFQGCTGIKSCGMLTATSIGTSGCESMFSGCSALATFSGAKTDKVGIRGCYAMFSGCPITAVPVLEARTIGNAGCQTMFSGCTKLVSLPAQLPATTINQYGCASMFSGCTSLQHGPEIMATTVSSYGCQSMFNGCSAMTSADKMHVRVMTPYCCASMYQGCKSMTTYADTISAVIIGFHSCEKMFAGASTAQAEQMKLTKAPIIAAQQVGAYGCSDMFNNCRSMTVDKTTLAKPTQLAAYCYNNMFYRCYAIKAAPDLPAAVLASYSYNYMFQECTTLVAPPKMGATTMDEFSCNYMFNGCIALDSVPELKAMKLAKGCYTYMFNGCVKLTKVPTLPATQMAPFCYQYMFNSCTALKTTPTLNAVNLAPGCYYYMYSGCTAIDTTQEILPANYLEDSCYMGMYNGCKLLRTAPTLPAKNWLDKDGVVQKNCYRSMFYNCAKLTCIRVFLKEWETATTTAIYQTKDWVYGVSKTGDFYKPLVLPDTTAKGALQYNQNHIPLSTTYPWNLHEITLHTFCTNGGTWDGLDTINKQRTTPLGEQLYAMKDGCLFTGWNTMPDGSGDTLVWDNPPSGEITYYAQYKVADIAVLDWESGSLVMQTTNTEATRAGLQVQGSGMPSVDNILSDCQMGIENPGLYNLKYDSASISTHAGELLNITMANATDTMGVLIVKIPLIISTSTASGAVYAEDSLDVWVINNSTYTIDNDMAMGNLYIQGGSKVVVTKDNTLSTNHITMRGGHMDATGDYTFCYPQLVANGSILNASGVIDYEYLINAEQFYNLYLPYSTNIGNITYTDGTRAVFCIEQYNGEVRKVGHTGWEIAWNSKTDRPPYPTLDCYRGYTISAMPQTIRMEGTTTDIHRAYSYVRMPMQVDLSMGELDSVRNMEVHGYGMTAGKLDAGIRPNDAGWNLVGNPYLANYGDVKGLVNNGIGLLVLNGGEYEWQGTLRYVVMPSNDGKTYTPELASTAKLEAYKNFFVQIGTGDALNFLLVNRAQNAPARMLSGTMDDRMLGVSLVGKDAKDRVGLLIGEDYTEQYEINADLDKWKNQGLNIYAKVGGYDLSMAAISEERAAEPVALSISNAQEGEYTFAVEEAWTGEWLDKGLYLMDAVTGIYTDLTTNTYRCQLPQGNCDGRFFLTIGSANAATDVADVTAGEGEPIVLSGRRLLTICQLLDAEVDIYSASGSLVYHGLGTGTLTARLPQGAYTVKIHQNDKDYVRKSVVY